jgi:hypothetical protein
MAPTPTLPRTRGRESDRLVTHVTRNS